jgi:hypothetical protein
VPRVEALLRRRFCRLHFNITDVYTPNRTGSGAMLLYHFTNAERLASILEDGLIPRVPDPECMTLSRPVVWLSAAETMMPTAADIEWMALKEKQGTFTKQEVEDFKANGFVFGDNRCRITVRLEHSKRLVHYSTWLACQTCPINGATAERQLAFLSPTTRAHWYVYFGRVQNWRLVETMALNADASAIIKRDFVDQGAAA